MRDLYLCFIFLQINLYAANSNWHALGHGFNGAVATIFIDSAEGKLYAGGQFNYADSIHCTNIAMWDGQHWDSLSHGCITCYTQYAIAKFQNRIYADGGYFVNNQNNYGGSFDGISWDSIGYGTNGYIFQIKEVNNKLWIAGRYSAAGAHLCPMLASWDGSNWDCLNIPYWNEIDDFEIYNGGIVIGGNFFDSTHANIDIAYYDSSSGVWSALGGGILGGWSGVYAIQTYRNDLYVSGLISTSAGNAGNNIMRWDGHQWNDVGGGTDGEVYCMNVYNDELYIGGAFTMAGGIHTGGMAKWDGIQWKPVSSAVFDPGIIEDIQFWNGQMYVGGYFWTIDSVTVNNIARFDGLTGIDVVKPPFNFSISPNPSMNSTTISFSSMATKSASVIITDVLGKEIIRSNIPPQTIRKEIDVSELTEGIYFLSFEADDLRVVKKFVKE